MKNRAKSGDIFAEKISNGQYMFGRVLLDVQEQCFKSSLVKRGESWLTNTSTGYLVEAYDLISSEKKLEKNYSTVIKGILVDSMSFEDGDWSIIGNSPINPKEINFNEDIGYSENEITLYKGELALTAELNDDRLFSVHSGEYLGSANLFECVLEQIGRNDLSTLPMNFSTYDFRFNQPDLRQKVYKAIGEDINMSYYDLALKHGFDTARFFNSPKTEKQSKTIDYSTLLKGVSWSFIGKKISSLKDFHKLAEENNLEIHSISVYNQPEIKIFVEYLDEQDKDREIEFMLKADNGKSFNADELLYKIHNEVVDELDDNDFHFFQGLTLLQKAAKGKPAVYSLDLGS